VLCWMCFRNAQRSTLRNLNSTSHAKSLGKNVSEWRNGSTTCFRYPHRRNPYLNISLFKHVSNTSYVQQRATRLMFAPLSFPYFLIPTTILFTYKAFPHSRVSCLLFNRTHCDATIEVQLFLAHLFFRINETDSCTY